MTISNIGELQSSNRQQAGKPGKQTNHYEYYKKLFIVNKVLENKIRELFLLRDDLNKRIDEVNEFNLIGKPSSKSRWMIGIN